MLLSIESRAYSMLLTVVDRKPRQLHRIEFRQKKTETILICCGIDHIKQRLLLHAIEYRRQITKTTSWYATYAIKIRNNCDLLIADYPTRTNGEIKFCDHYSERFTTILHYFTLLFQTTNVVIDMIPSLAKDIVALRCLSKGNRIQCDINLFLILCWFKLKSLKLHRYILLK